MGRRDCASSSAGGGGVQRSALALARGSLKEATYIVRMCDLVGRNENIRLEVYTGTHCSAGGTCAGSLWPSGLVVYNAGTA